jgi:hypothetical protein
MLAQQASIYDVGGRNFHIQEQPMHKNFNFSRAGVDQSDQLTSPLLKLRRLSRLLQSARLIPPSRLS